jgi:hypothetical protein
VPVCHTRLAPEELPIPSSISQAIEARSATGLNRLYALIANTLGCQIPKTDFLKLIEDISTFEHQYLPTISKAHGPEIEKRAAAKKRLYDALGDPSFKWRNIERLDILSGLSEDEVLEVLLPDPNVAFGKGKKSGKRIARLKDRDG